MKMNLLRLFSVLVVLFAVQGCEKDPASSSMQDQTVTPSLRGAFIVNEGNYSHGNASLSYYNADSLKLTNGVYNLVNHESLGDIANFMVIKDSLGFIVINNSDKIDIININTFKKVKSISLPAGSSPREMAVLENNRGYVTNLYKNSISVLDLSKGAVTGSIDVGPNPEGIIATGNNIYVANSGLGNGNTVSVISGANGKLVKTIQVGDNPQGVALDAEGRIQVLCGGAYGSDFMSPDDDTPGGIWIINPGTNTLSDSLVLQNGLHPSELTLSGTGKGYFIYDGAIVEYDTQAMEIRNSALIKGNFYHVRVNAYSGELFVLDSGNYADPGTLLIYDSDGTLKNQYEVGIIPGFVCFVNR